MLEVVCSWYQKAMLKGVLAVALLAACGDNGSTIDAAPAVDQPVDASVCNTLAVPTAVMEQASATDAPTPTGGTIAPGTYVLTAFTIFTGAGGASGPTGLTFAATSVDTATTFNYLQVETQGATSQTLRSAGTYTIEASTSTITIVDDCTGGTATQFGLDTSPTSFTLYVQASIAPPAVNALLFTLQP